MAIIPMPMPIIMNNSTNNNTHVEICLSRSENLDILYKYNKQEKLTEDDEQRLTSCVEEEERACAIFDTIVGLIVSILIVAIIAFGIWAFFCV